MSAPTTTFVEDAPVMFFAIFCPGHGVARFFRIWSSMDVARAMGEWQGREHAYEPCEYAYWSGDGSGRGRP